MENISASVVRPEYTGGGLVNLVAELAAHFGVDTGHPRLGTAGGLCGGVSRVVLLVCDALGALSLQAWLEGGAMPWLHGMLRRGDARLESLTTVFPSTTAAALSSIHTGATPAEHGYLGYSLWLGPGPGVTDMLLGRDRYTHEPRALPAVPPSLYPRLAAAGVSCQAVNASAFATSALSTWHFAGAAYRGYWSANTLPSLVAEAADAPAPAYITAYWPAHDTVCHVHGPGSPQVADELAVLDLVLDRLVGRLPRTGHTPLLLVGDQGQRALVSEAAVYLGVLCLGPPAGERTAAYLREEPGLSERLSPFAILHPARDLWQEGWFGGPPARESFRQRVGDLLAIPRAGRQLLWRQPGRDAPEPYRGGHGGWSAAEMLVPLVSLRL